MREPKIKLTGGPHGLPRNVVVNIQRERLMKATAEVIAEEGYIDTTVHKILARAGVSRRTFYEIFKDREDCFLATYDAVAAHILDLVRETCAEHPEAQPAERIEAGLRAMLEFGEREPAVARMCIVEVLAAGRRARERRAATMEQFTAMLADVLGEVCKSPDEAWLSARVFTGGVHELVYEALAADKTESLPALADRMVKTYLPLLSRS